MEERGRGAKAGVERGTKASADGLRAMVARRARTEGTRYFFLSIVGMSVRSAFSHITCPEGGYSRWCGGPSIQEMKVQEYGLGTSGECAQPQPCVSLETGGGGENNGIRFGDRA